MDASPRALGQPPAGVGAQLGGAGAEPEPEPEPEPPEPEREQEPEPAEEGDSTGTAPGCPHPAFPSAWQPRVDNLCRRFQGVDKDAVVAALNTHGGHAGKAAGHLLEAERKAKAEADVPKAAEALAQVEQVRALFFCLPI